LRSITKICNFAFSFSHALISFIQLFSRSFIDANGQTNCNLIVFVDPQFCHADDLGMGSTWLLSSFISPPLSFSICSHLALSVEVQLKIRAGSLKLL